ncbi:glucose oxidase [Penicillium atrosanguineum]|nr:glucose oxidase [Penicillium atrosanguineum]
MLMADPLKVSGKTYDYVITGGGLTGLTTAARLTSDARITVLVIESGFYQSSRGPIVEDLNSFGEAFGTTLDHAFQTVSLDINGRPLTFHSGNGLGGSTLINGATYTSPSKVQIDSWESHLGNGGWNFDNISSYIRRNEKARPPTPEQIEAGHSYKPECHGTHGDLHVGPRGGRLSPIIKRLMGVVKKGGAPIRRDLSCGNPKGVSMFLNTMHANGTRSDTAREYLLPHMTRPNLSVLVGQKVGKVLINQKVRIPSARGVEFGTDGQRFEVYAKHEVILAAGALMSPLILEYSGVGLKTVLEAAGVPQIVDLPVGLNLQDQTTTTMMAQTKDEGQGQAAYFATLDDLFSTQDIETARELLSSQLNQWADDAIAEGGFSKQNALKSQLELYRHWILDKKVAYAELFMDVRPLTVGFSIWVLLPFTRGKIHITHKDPFLWKYALDPRYLENDLDRLSQAAATRLARNLLDAMHPLVLKETFPGSVVPDNATTDDWISYVAQNFQPNFHAIGTCSMMAKELGGVVDPSGKVYGVPALRVVDASIIPTQVSAHTSALTLWRCAKTIRSDSR